MHLRPWDSAWLASPGLLAAGGSVGESIPELAVALGGVGFATWLAWYLITREIPKRDAEFTDTIEKLGANHEQSMNHAVSRMEVMHQENRSDLKVMWSEVRQLLQQSMQVQQQSVKAQQKSTEVMEKSAEVIQKIGDSAILNEPKRKGEGGQHIHG